MQQPQQYEYDHQQTLLLDRDSTPKATLLNPPFYQSQHYHHNNHHSRYYSETTQYSTNATTSGSIRSAATNTRSINPVSALPTRPSAAKQFFSKFKTNRAFSVNEATANQHRGLRTFDLEKQQRSSWQYHGGEPDDVLGEHDARSPGFKKKGLVNFFKGLF
jgi:hypothetical protein